MATNDILLKMLDRLFGSLVSGPGMNCRPHSSRQRVDVSQLSRLLDVSPEELLRQLLGEERGVKLTGKAVKPRKGKEERDESVELSEEERRVQRQWTEQNGLMGKLRTIAEDAKTYEQDTGVHVLAIGFPLLSLPPGSAGGRGFMSRRVMAPVAFIPVTLEVKSGSAVSVSVACKGEGVDLVRPNIALLSWLEQQTGKRTPDLFEDKEAENPWREIRELVKHVAASLRLEPPAVFSEEGLGAGFKLESAPRSEDDSEGRILASAVMGLYPMANEGLLRDMQAMAGGEETGGPLKSFLEVDVELGGVVEEHAEEAEVGLTKGAKNTRSFADERLVTMADPCQSRAALMARKASGLVIHGPPGTGKSQTITNIIGDHLARGQRVLMVCDKRTALDVVAHRLDYLGFGGLVALVHDPQRDQRDLYKKIRERLEGLAEVRTNSRAAKEVERIDAELQGLHNDLTAYWKTLMAAKGEAASFHELMGEWLAIEGGEEIEQGLNGIGLEEGRSHGRVVRELLERGVAARYGENPWREMAGISLKDFLGRSLTEIREKMRAAVEAAIETVIEVGAEVPAVKLEQLEAEGPKRAKIADSLERVTKSGERKVLAYFAGCKDSAFNLAHHRMHGLKDAVPAVRAAGLEEELLSAVRGAMPTVAGVNVRLRALERYLETARKWYGFLSIGAKKEAREVLAPLGLQLSAEDAERARLLYQGLKSRLLIRDTLAEAIQEKPGELPGDIELLEAVDVYSGTILVLLMAQEAPQDEALLKLVRETLADPARGAAVSGELKKSAAKCAAWLKTEAALGATGLCAAGAFRAALGRHVDAAEYVGRLMDHLPQVENVLRIRDGLAGLPKGLAETLEEMLKRGAEAESGARQVEKGLLAAEISRRLREDPVLQTMDGQRLKSTFDRYRVLEQQKQAAVREAALHHWVNRQKERLLASTMTRMSAMGADLRRRLTMRGERAMRLRQVVEAGHGIEGGDPLFDMCPVWMASPETVAQIFPRKALFDIVIFDEASQCRLEEALPVLTRGKRVVIAGDPKQLPPTRFFESAVTASEDEDASGEQDLFEKQQGAVEDLLTAALNLSIENAYLDVHYRSRNSDLIAFSNTQFYNQRLQAIPGHPANSTRFCPLTLYRAEGIYEERANEKEAEVVCRIVRDLLRRAEPPSIGIACFNLVQRDLIVEKLDALALEDAEFARALAAARTRRGSGSFEGLFVKNLENVQGDERDHIIISTTYGPQKDGKFYQRFGPLGRAGGGRRLNVLVTRAREEVHLVTSIPAEVYRSLPPVPTGQTPGGAWLLYAYLQFAEQLAAAYKNAGATEEGKALAVAPEVVVHAREQSLPSVFAESLAKRLAEGQSMGSQVHWGNDGFCVDVAVAHPRRPGDVTIGVLCDSNRYLQAPDPVEWDLFRMMVHESQGWQLRRVWTPQFFRDSAGEQAGIVDAVRTFLANEKPPDALGVVPAVEEEASEEEEA